MTRLQRIRERVEKATEGPWKRGQPTYGPNGRDGWFEDHHVWAEKSDTAVVCNEDGCHTRTDDIEFVAHARSDVPFLLGLIDEAVSLLRANTYNGDFCDEPACISCLSPPWKKHGKDCALAALLRRVEE